MRAPIIIPVDYTLDVFEITQWHKQAGSVVKRGDILLSYETQKENLDISSDVDGTVIEILVQANEKQFRPDTIKFGGWDKTVGYIETETSPLAMIKEPEKAKETATSPPVSGEEKKREKIRLSRDRYNPDGSIKQTPEEKTPETPLVQKITPPPAEGPDKQETKPKASPLVRKTAQEKGIDLSRIQGTGPDGTIILEDLERVQVPRDSEMKTSDDFELLPLTARRRGIASNLTKSWQEIPHAASSVIVDMSKIAEKRKRIKAANLDNSEAAKILSRWDTFVLSAITHNIKTKWQIINAAFTWEGIKIHKHINLGISTADPNGLLVPIIHNAETMPWSVLAKALDTIYKNVSANRLTAKDYKNGTFTFNNPGVLGGYDGRSLIPYNGGSTILSMHEIVEQKSIFGIVFDHRTYDGREAVGFLNDIKYFLEHIDEQVMQ